MPSSSNPFNLVSAALVIGCGAMVAPLGVVGAVAETGTMRWVFGLLLAAGLLMIGGGVQAIFSWRRATRAEAGHEAELRGAARAPAAHGTAADEPASGVLAHWSYTPEEWSGYNRREYRFRKREAAWLGIGVAALGTVVLPTARPVSYPLAAAVAVPLGALFWAARLLIARGARAGNAATAGGEVVISPRAVLLNGRYHVLEDDRFHFGGVRYVADRDPPLLEFTVTWETRKGTTGEQVRVPVPRGREAEARALAASFPEAPFRP